MQPQVNPRVIREGNLHFDGDSPHLRPTCHDFNTSLKNLGHTTNPFPSLTIEDKLESI